MIVIDKLCYSSKLRYVNPFEKFAFTMLTLIFCVVSRSIVLGILVMAVNSYLTVFRGGISAARYRNLMTVPLGFLLLSVFAVMINVSRKPLDAFAIPVGNLYLTAGTDGLIHGAQLIITALAAVSCLYFLSLNTTMTDILDVLKKLHVPDLIIELMLLIYRYIFILLDTAYYLTTAQKSRLGHKDLKTSLKSFGAMTQILFVHAMNRSRALYDAMESRGYDGRLCVLSENYPPKRRNIVLIVLYESFLLAFTLYIKLLV